MEKQASRKLLNSDAFLFHHHVSYSLLRVHCLNIAEPSSWQMRKEVKRKKQVQLLENEGKTG